MATRTITPSKWATLAVIAAAIVVAFLGSGVVVGTPINEAADGWLSATATPVAPATPAFRIWSAIYLGLAALAVFQLVSDSPRLGRARWLIAASAALNAVWIVIVQAGWLPGSLVVIVVLLLVLVATLVALGRGERSLVERIVVDATMGLYLGWVCVATVANAVALLWSTGYRGAPLGEAGFAVAALVVAALVVVGLTFALHRLAPAVGAAWGLAWIAARMGEQPFVGTVAAVLALVVVVLGVPAVLTERRAVGGRATGVRGGLEGAGDLEQ